MVNYSHVLRMLHWLNLEGKKFPSLSPLIKTSVHWPLPGPPFISIDLLFVICYECMYKLKDCSLHVNQQSIIFLFVFFLPYGTVFNFTPARHEIRSYDNFSVSIGQFWSKNTQKFCQTLQSCQQFCHKQ